METDTDDELDKENEPPCIPKQVKLYRKKAKMFQMLCDIYRVRRNV